ncbi:unnamed protein product [Allacma fusca]|uniref:CHK kinase-like domain-containing protein n=1 Tax=Allacma fusca TaxID=39272 RepID=A0A8J2PDD7_9HEXA|nr:unnamed protein product [Allacma fusca]
MPSVFVGLSYLEASLILKEQAKFHAYSYALIRYQGEQLFEEQFYRLDLRNKRDFREEKLEAWHFMLATSVDIAVDVLKRINPKLALQLKTEIPPETVGKLYSSLTDATDKLLFPCILHGDLWSNNCLLKYDKEGKPCGVKFVDFQHTRRGNIFEDLVYFILTSTTTEMRSQHLCKVLEDYFQSFEAALEGINVEMPIGFSLGFLFDNFNRYLRWGLSYMCFAIPLQLGNPADVYKEQANRKKQNGVDETYDTEAEPNPETAGNDLKENLQLMFESSLPARQRLEDITMEILNRK